MLMLDRLQWTRQWDLALQQSLSTQGWFTGWPASNHHTALAVEQGT
jgi:hypothetical protein